ncbi:MAG: CvpA family protein [Clostridia bacterium]|nr:CvpA family protein [Clostridia bacterium]
MFNLLAISPVVALGGLNVALIDLIFFGLMLIAIIIGIAKGFLRQILSILGIIAAIVLSVILCKHLAGLIENKIPSITNGVSGMVEKIFGLSGVATSGTKEQIIETLQTTKIPSFLHSIVANSIIESAGELGLTSVLTRWALVAISFVVIFILSLILFAIVKKLFKALTRIKAVGFVDRILGALFMALKFMVLALVLVTVLSVFIDMNSLLSPVLESGKPVKSVFNSLMTAIMDAPFIQKLLI